MRTHPQPSGPLPDHRPCLHHLFERQAARTPEAVAVSCDGRHLTYRDLDRRADQLARQLRRADVGPGHLVGLCVERSLELVVGVLGILKAGGAYVPLDPAYPAERLAVMLDDAQVSVLVTQANLTARLPPHAGRVVCLGPADVPLAERLDDEGPAAGSPPQDADDLAYVIFTSGSTGRPKGVQVTHHNVVRLFTATRDWFHFDRRDVWTLFHSYAFDFSVWEIWGPLLYGGRLVVVPQAVSRSPQAFYQLLRRERVTVLNQTPSAFRQLIRAEEAAGPACDDLALRLVIFGGEALALPTLKPWFDRHGDAKPQLVNMYGITETTVHVTYRPITRADVEAGRGSVIGRPIPDLSVRLLDPEGRPVPDGEPGEMVVGGAGVARGYLNRPDLTAERFVPDPTDPAGRLYKSGDLARRLPDGDLVYLGRIDHQVKVRGFRIELLEIEAVLARHPAVREAAVLAREDDGGEKRLVAYVVPRTVPAPTARELRLHVQAHLPEYMVPAAFVPLSVLPTTSNGKVDRAALPPPPSERAEGPETFVAPATAAEQRLQRIWEALLKVRPVGVRDDFFELGGDSLLAMQLSVAVQQEFGQELPSAVLLDGATIEHLARALDRPRPAARWASLLALQLHGQHPPFFCTHGLGGQVLGYRQLARRLGCGQPFYAFQARELTGDYEPFATIEDMAAHYVAEMRQVQPEGPYYLGGYSLGAMVALEMAQQLHRQGQAVAFLAMLDDGPALSHERPEWSAGEVARFLANVPFWLRHEVLKKPPSELGADVVRKLRVWGRKLTQTLGRAAGRAWRPLEGFPVRHRQALRTVRAGTPSVLPADLEEVLDVSRYPASARPMLEAHYQALKDYVPRPYAGRITVFRARSQPLLGSHQPDLGWGRLAAGGVAVRVVPGDHNSLLREPYVRGLGTQLDAALREARGG